MAEVGTGINYPEIIEKTLRDPDALRYSREYLLQTVPTVFDSREVRTHVRVSDAGACSLSLYAELHGLLDTPENVRMVDSRMQPGTMDGWRTAALIRGGIRRFCWPFTSQAEVELDCRGTPGHADVIVYTEPDPIEVVECKYTLWSSRVEPPEERHRYWLYQACKYAMGVGAPAFVILVHAPAVWKSEQRVAFRYATADWADETDEEYARLAQAVGDEPPEADALEEFRCKSCRYSVCDRNENPLSTKPKRAVEVS